MTIQVKATEQYVSVMLLVMLYKVVLTFTFDDEILKCAAFKRKLLDSTLTECCLNFFSTSGNLRKFIQLILKRS